MLGLMNRRSHVLWAVDLIQLLGLSISNTSVQQYNLVIVQANSIPLGLAIQRVQGITWLETDAIQAPPGQVSLGIVPYLSGCVLQQQNVLLILDAAAIVQSSSSLIKLHPLNRGNLTNSLPQ
jgi:twitching motility protein PilI